MSTNETRDVQQWRYTGLDENSIARRSGLVLAVDSEAAVAAARRQGLIGVSVSKEVSRTGGGSRLRSGSTAERMAFLNSLALINSAVPSLSTTLEIASQQVSTRSRLRPAVDSLIEATKSGGESLDQAFAAQADVWGRDVSAVVAAGIQSGNLSESLRILSEHKERSARIARKVRRTFTKPILSFIVVVAVMWLTMTVAVPQAVEFAADVDVEIPSLTQWAIDGGDFLNQWGILGTVLIASVVMLIYFLHESPQHGVEVSERFLRAPVIGKILKGQAVSLAAGVIAVALTASAKPYEAVEWAADSTKNKRVRAALRNVTASIEAGAEFSEAMDEERGIIPPEMTALARQSFLGIADAGEQWQRYATAISDDTESKVDSLSESMSALINVGMVAALGYASMAATMPMMSVLTEVISNPAGGG